MANLGWYHVCNRALRSLHHDRPPLVLPSPSCPCPFPFFIHFFCLISHLLLLLLALHTRYKGSFACLLTFTTILIGVDENLSIPIIQTTLTMQFFNLVTVFGLAALVAAVPQAADSSVTSMAPATSSSASGMMASAAPVSPLTSCLATCE
jgi:hypothetical protein